MQKINKKIVYLSDDFPPLALGGAGQIAYEEATAMARHGHDVLVISIAEDKNNMGESVIGGVRVIRIFSKYHPRWRGYVSLSNSRVVEEVGRILSREKPDIIHAHNIHTHLSYKVLSVARRHAEKVFLTAHDAMLVYYGKFIPQNKNLKVSAWQNFKEQKFHFNPFRNLVIRHYIKNVDIIFSVSDALREFLEINGIKNIVTLHNGIDAVRWQNLDAEKIEAFRQKFDLQNKKVILFAGRISGVKGGRIILEIFKKVHSILHDSRLLVVGTQGHEDIHGVIFTGVIPREDMKYVYALSDVVVVPSLYLDPFPTINLEAMASSKPVVGTSFGGTKEAIKDGETGFIVNPHETVLFAQKIELLLKEDDLADEISYKGHVRFLEKFTIQTHLTNLLAWYNGSPK